MANRTLNFEAGNGNWWRRCNHKRKVLIGSEHTFHWLHWHTSSSFSGKMVEKLWGNYAIWFGFFDNGLWRELMVSLVIFSESISSGQSVLIKIWCFVDILKLIWPKKVTLAKLNGNSLLYRNHRIYGVSPPLSCFLWWPSTIGKLSEIMYVHHICNS